MKTAALKILLIIIILLSNVSSQARNIWPKEIPLKDGGKITIYQPQPETLVNNILSSRAAIAIKKNAKTEPVFGVIWAECTLESDRATRMATLANIKITDAKFPDAADVSKADSLKAFLAKEITKWDLEISLDELTTTLEQNNRSSDDKLNTAPPKIIYSDKPATLLLFDGKPIVKKDDKMNMERAINTPVLIVKSPEDSKYYMYGQKIWYSSSTLTESWEQAKKLPKSITSINEQIVKYEKEKNDTSKAPTPVPVIIVSTEPTELIQSKGEPKFASIEKTGLLYMQNSDNNIFMEVTGQQYYVLLAGRWYKSPSLKGPWAYIASDQLPADFAKIPEGSEKDVVLANVAGTPAAREAVMDAQIPQTAKVDRKTATTKVTYDGEPKFENIAGTKLDLAVNTSSTVLRADGKYYCVDNGVWFTSASPAGPWVVSDKRPADVDSIPATSPAYNTKYVYVYESTPEVVYVGYTPGYTGCYVYGPTIVYGTGYYYAPWYGVYYYPHPVTYGVAVVYNPYVGWSMAVGFSVGVAMHYGCYHGGYYGPPYHYPPPYHGGYHGGYYGGSYRGNTNINIDNSNNFYRNQGGASTRPSQGSRPSGGNNISQQPANRPGNGAGTSQQPANRPSGGGPSASQQPANREGGAPARSQQPSNMAQPSNKASNNMYSDKQGNVYRQNDKGGFDQRSNGGWNSASPSASQNMQRESQNRQRSSSMQGGYSGGGRSGGGGGRGGGGRR